MTVVLRLHPYQSHLHHGEAQRFQTSPPRPGAVQLVQLPRHHLTQNQAHAARRQPGRQPLLGCHAVDHDAHLAEVVFSFSGPAGDPGGLAQTELAPDHQGVGWVLAAAVAVEMLQGQEVSAGVEGVGAGEELRTGPNFTSEHGRMKWLIEVILVISSDMFGFQAVVSFHLQSCP